MNIIMNFRTVLLLLAIFICFPTPSSDGLFKVVRIYDGDTIKAEGHDIEIKVRLIGIDAPEISKGKRKPGQPSGRQAEKYLAGAVEKIENLALNRKY